MEDTGGQRTLSLCGTILNQEKLLNCDRCGAVLGPAQYLDFVQKRTSRVARLADDRRLCDACARESSAQYSVDEAPVKKV